jgi:excisionase family DNA binding protein
MTAPSPPTLQDVLEARLRAILREELSAILDQARPGRPASSSAARPPSTIHTPGPTNGGNLLTVPEAAVMLNIQQDTLRHWLCDRRLPFVKIGGRTRLRRHDVEAYIEAQTIPATPPPR